VFAFPLKNLGRDRRELDQLEAEWLFRVEKYVRSHEWQTDGHASAAAAIAKQCRMTGVAPRAAVRLAQRLPSDTGPAAGPPTSTTSNFSAGNTTAKSTSTTTNENEPRR
jgi:hypothetical protein